MTNLLALLAQPFAPAHISFKPGATKGDRCMALTYADLRAYQERLDAVCGLDWSVEYLPWGDDRIIAKLSIGGVTRCSTGESDVQDAKNGMAGTVGEAQAFKRAAAMFGLGRYLYDLPSQWVEFDAQRKRITDAGLRQLDQQYRSWYARQVADDSDAEEEPAPGAGNDGNPFDDAPEPAILSPEQLKRLNTLGYDLYGSKAAWDGKRPQLVKAASSRATSSSRELTPDQAQLLIDGLDKRLKEKRRMRIAA